MFCGNCGAENANGAKFCKGCGKPLGSVRETEKIVPPDTHDKEGAAEPSSDIDTTTGQTTEKIKAVPKKIIIGACAVVVALIVIICIAVNAGSTINLDDYLTIEVSGYDGYGTVSAQIDWDAIEQKYGNKISYTNKAKSEYGEFLSLITPVEEMQEYISVEIDPDENLSNGDEVAYTWNIDEDLTEYIKCKVKYKDGTYTVSDLTGIGTFDAFADLSVEFSGIAPNGTANLNYIGSELDVYDFDCENTSGLSNGDKIKVTIDESCLEYCAEDFGKVPAELEKEYTVEGLDSYLMNFSEVDDASLNSMKQQAEDEYTAYAAKNWDEDGAELQSLTYIGNYLLTAKSSDTWDWHNILYLVYKAQVKNSYSYKDESFEEVNDVYWYISYYDLLVDSSGAVTVDVAEYDTAGNYFAIDSGVNDGWFGTKEWYYYGYQTLDELYKDVVTENLDLYNHEDNIDESVAPEVVEESTATVTGDYKLPNSDTELITLDDLEGFSAEDCKIARNEIYARHGRKFQDPELQAYFDALDWYEGTIEPDDFQETDLSDIEIANKDLIVQYEEENGYN